MYQAHAEVSFWKLHALPCCFSHQRLFYVPCLQGTLYILLYAVILTDCLLQALTERTANVSSTLLTNQRLAWEFVGGQAVAPSFSVWASQALSHKYPGRRCAFVMFPCEKSKLTLVTTPARHACHELPLATSSTQLKGRIFNVQLQ